ncbi:MAG: hypothetical protein JWO19_5470 [Bryobacterales bacterium]|nr:hypothetical protein [Bryobacterales bacterium]
MAEIRIGTSGWHYKHWIGTFYPARWPASKMLAWYQARFDTVELNNTFYRLPPEKALKQWRSSTPANFVFAVKGSRFLTHMKKLKDPAPGLEKFFSRVDLLKEKLGPILFQLPPNFEVNIPRLQGFLDALPRRHRYAFEFRNPTWNSPEVFRLLCQRNAAYCPFHLAGYQSPIEITADFTYVRLHGPGGKYQGSYDDDALKSWARRTKKWRRELKAIYVYFDNDDSGYAALNALRLRELLS